jgi:hypothetical protein
VLTIEQRLAASSIAGVRGKRLVERLAGFEVEEREDVADPHVVLQVLPLLRGKEPSLFFLASSFIRAVSSSLKVNSRKERAASGESPFWSDRITLD